MHDTEEQERKKKRKRIFLSIYLLTTLLGIITMTAVFSGKSFNPSNNSTIGMEFLQSDNMWHIWNEEDDYFINSTSGIQLTNDYLSFWSKNEICLEAYTNQYTNYCTDSFNMLWEASTDNQTYANLSGTTTLTQGAYAIQLDFEYYIENNWTMIKFTPSATNPKKEFTEARFKWKITDIRIMNTTDNNSFWVVNNSQWQTYALNESVDLFYDNVVNRTLWINRNMNTTEDEDAFGIKIKWNESKWINGVESAMAYNLTVKSEAGQINAPITLTGEVGTLAKGDVFTTNFFWRDPTYTMTGNSLTENDTSVNADVWGNNETLSLTMNINADSNKGKWFLSVTDGTNTIDGDCSDAGDYWYLLDVQEDGTVCTANPDLGTGELYCDGGTGTQDEVFILMPCNNANDADDYNFESACRGNGANDACSGFPDLSGAVSVNGFPTFSTDLASNASVPNGEDVNFSATGTDEESDNYFLLVCSSNSTSGATCVDDNRCTSATVASATEASCAYTTTAKGTLTSYGFLCDVNNNCNSGYMNETDVTASPGTLNITYLSVAPTSLDRNTTFYLNATVNCTGGTGKECGTVTAYARYNDTVVYPTTLINGTEGAEPMFSKAQWSIVNDEGDGTADTNSYIMGDTASNKYYNSTFIDFTPTMNFTITSISLNIEAFFGSDYGFLVNFSICFDNGTLSVSDCTLVKADYDPLFSIGWQTIPINSYDITYDSANPTRNYTLRLGSDSTNNNNFGDLLSIATDSSASTTKIGWIYSDSSTLVRSEYADIIFYGYPTKSATLNDGESFNVSWLINATGLEGTKWYVDIHANSTQNGVVETNSTDTLITLNGGEEEVDTAQAANLTIEWFTPTINSNHTNSTLVNYTINLTCTHADCHANVTLDPVQSTGILLVYDHGGEHGSTNCNPTDTNEDDAWRLITNNSHKNFTCYFTLDDDNTNDNFTNYSNDYARGDFGVMVVFSSVNSASNAHKWRNLTYPVVVLGDSAQIPMEVCSSEDIQATLSNVNVTNVTHPIMSHYTGNGVQPYGTNAQSLGCSAVGSGMLVLGTRPDTNNPMFGVYENQSVMADSSLAPARRGLNSIRSQNLLEYSNESNYTIVKMIDWLSYGMGQTKGVIQACPAEPFCTDSTNPVNVTIPTNTSYLFNWTVNATGTINDIYGFFAFAELVDNASESVTSNTIDITITEADAAADPCDCPASGNWELTSETCTITVDCDLQGNDLIWINSNVVIDGAKIHNTNRKIKNTNTIINRINGGIIE